MKLLLIAPLQSDANIQNFGSPSLGLIRIDSYLRANLKDIEITIFDQQINSYDPFVKFKDDKIDILGISLLHYTLIDTLEFIDKWKKIHHESLIVVGGNESCANYQEIFDKSKCDIAVLVEGEEPMLNIVKWKQGLIKLEDIEGIIHRKHSKIINDNDLWEYWKNVDFSNYRYDEYNKKYQTVKSEQSDANDTYVRLVTSSHCQRKCTFCSLALVRQIACGKNTKPASLNGIQIMELVCRINKQVPSAKGIYFVTDDVFYPNKQEFYNFVDLYIQSGYNYRILCQSSTYSLTEKEFQLLNKLGCDHLTIGIENVSESVRKSLHKIQSSEKIENIIKWSKQYKVPVYFLIILFPPVSTFDDLKENYETLTRWQGQGVQISCEPIIHAYRGTSIFDEIHDITYKIKKVNNKIIKDSVYVMPDDQDVKEFVIEFLNRKDDFVKNELSKKGLSHTFKGSTGKYLIELLGIMLRERF